MNQLRFSWFNSKLITGVAYGCLQGLYMIEIWRRLTWWPEEDAADDHDPQIHSDLTRQWTMLWRCICCLSTGGCPSCNSWGEVCLSLCRSGLASCSSCLWSSGLTLGHAEEVELKSRPPKHALRWGDGGFHGHHFFDPFLGTQKQWKWRTSSGCQRTSASWMLRLDSIVSHLAWHRWTTKSHLHQPM